MDVRKWLLTAICVNISNSVLFTLMSKEHEYPHLTNCSLNNMTTIWLLRINKTWPTKTGNLKISHTSSSYSLNGERDNKRRNFENYRNTEGYVVSEVTKYMLERFFCQLLYSKRKEETGLFSTENLISDPSKKRPLSTQKIKTKCPKQFKFERIY